MNWSKQSISKGLAAPSRRASATRGDVGTTGHEHHRGVWRQLLDFAKRLDPIEVGHLELHWRQRSRPVHLHHRAREWDAAHPREPSAASPLNRYFCDGLQKRKLSHRDESGVPKGSFTLYHYHAGRRDTDRRLSCQWRSQGESHLSGRQNSKGKRRLPPELDPAFRQRAVTPVPVEPPAGPR